MKNRNFLPVYLIAIAIVALIFSAQFAAAEDKILDLSVDSMTVALTKNGNEYVRFIVTEDRSLNGVAYKRSLPVMAFGADHVAAAKAYNEGDQLKAVAKYSSQYESYTILSFIQ
jgi:hypothetical protein